MQVWEIFQVNKLYIYINFIFCLENEYTIYVGDLDASVTEDILKEFFASKYKSVISAKLVVDNITKIGKGYGFVKFSEQSESLTAINEMNGKVLCGRQIKTK